MTICKVSLTIGSGPAVETSASCELTCDGDEEAKLSARQIARLQGVCLAVIRQHKSLASDSGGGERSRAGSAALRQLARLYRAATRIPAFDLTHLQRLSQRLYQKPLDQLSMLEVAGMTSTLKAILNGTLDAKEVLEQPYGHAGKC